MTATLDGVTSKKKDKPEPTAEQKLAEDMVARAREQGVSLTGPDGLLKQLTKTVLETALNQEMTEHLTTPTRRDTDPQLMPRDERLAAEAGSRLSGQGVTVAVRWREGPGW